MFCKSCGKQIYDDSIFCSYCGTRQSEHNKPTVHEPAINSHTEAKTVNANLSFGRQSQQSKYVIKESFEKYDLTYEKETEATVVGIILIVILIFIFAIGGVKDRETYSLLTVISAIGRIIITVWCVNIAKRQNRQTIGWGFFAFFLPSLALIIIGQLKKINREEVCYFDKSKNDVNSTQIEANSFQSIKLPIPSATTIDALKNDNFTLRYMIKEYKRYMKEKNDLFPMYAALELDKRGESLNKETMQSINSYSVEQGFNSFIEMVEYYNQND